MTTQITRAYMVTCTLILSLLSTGVLPATTYAASQGAQHRSATAATHSNAPQRTSVEPTSLNAPTSDKNVVTAQTTAETDSTHIVKSSSVSSSTHSPAGNNGFIKVNEEVVPDSTPNNDPHVSCQFKVEFYNYDYNPSYRAKVSFALHNPTSGSGYTIATSGNLNPIIGGDAASGGNDLDAVEAYRLAFTGQPHAKQGYHVKLTIHADGSRGADVKHKVFWVQPCEGQVLGSSDGGHILATSTTKAALPATLPSTGTNQYGFVVTLLASALAYIITLGAQKLRAFRLEV